MEDEPISIDADLIIHELEDILEPAEGHLNKEGKYINETAEKMDMATMLSRLDTRAYIWGRKNVSAQEVENLVDNGFLAIWQSFPQHQEFIKSQVQTNDGYKRYKYAIDLAEQVSE